MLMYFTYSQKRNGSFVRSAHTSSYAHNVLSVHFHTQMVVGSCSYLEGFRICYKLLRHGESEILGATLEIEKGAD
jgi:hypothetical protein